MSLRDLNFELRRDDPELEAWLGSFGRCCICGCWPTMRRRTKADGSGEELCAECIDECPTCHRSGFPVSAEGGE